MKHTEKWTHTIPPLSFYIMQRNLNSGLIYKFTF